jgi:hypothetical protein
VAALDGTASFDLGGYEIAFTATNHSGSRFVDIAVVSSSGKLLF